MVRHGDAFRLRGRAHRGLHGDPFTANGTGLHRLRPERSGGRRTPTILFRDAKPEDFMPLAAESSGGGK
jgi:hypothetical protein